MSTREFYEREYEITIRKALWPKRWREKAADRAHKGKPAARLSLGLEVKSCKECARGDCTSCVYKQEFERLMALPNCNDCRYRARCEFSPHIGETARINCPTWAPEEKEANT
jgi:hypothetical protein